jgi:hypothetical protein
MRHVGPLLLLAAVLGGCSGGDDGAATLVSPPRSDGGGDDGSTLTFDLDAPEAAPVPHVIDGTPLGCTCKLTMNFTTMAPGQQGPLTLNGATLRVTNAGADAGADAGVDLPITLAPDTAVGGLSVIALDDPTRSAVVVPPAGHYCVVVEYTPKTISAPTVRVVYGGTREFVAGPAGEPVQSVLSPRPGFVNSVVVKMTPAINSVRITPGSGGGIGVPAICFGTDPPAP